MFALYLVVMIGITVTSINDWSGHWSQVSVRSDGDNGVRS